MLECNKLMLVDGKLVRIKLVRVFQCEITRELKIDMFCSHSTDLLHLDNPYEIILTELELGYD